MEASILPLTPPPPCRLVNSAHCHQGACHTYCDTKNLLMTCEIHTCRLVCFDRSAIVLFNELGLSLIIATIVIIIFIMMVKLIQLWDLLEIKNSMLAKYSFSIRIGLIFRKRIILQWIRHRYIVSPHVYCSLRLTRKSSTMRISYNPNNQRTSNQTFSFTWQILTFWK